MHRLNSKQIAVPVLALLMLAGSAFAQAPKMEPEPGKARGMGECRMSEPGHMIPGLTEEQQTRIKTMRVEHMKAMQSLRNQLGEKKARLRTLTTGDKVNMTEVNKMIDEIGSLRTKMMKQKEQHRQEIRNLLNDEQRIFFDTRHKMHEKGERQRHEAMPRMR
ncbi:periplasmic heavy metal sensor [candidate division WOR-3 bacterium]|nr:periplasmic heavy metal sensor [candidate division WOR-3 bacterium]